jgi:simple sugar transport system ATP-binding protein
MQISDRILVLCDGKVTGLVNAREITKEALGLMMAGHVQKEGGDYSGNKSYKNA